MHARTLPLPSGPQALGRRGQRVVGAALGLSLAVHLAALGLVPDWRRAALPPPPPPVMRATLLPPSQPAPVPAPLAATTPPPPPVVASAPAPTPKPQPVRPRPVIVARQDPAPKAPRVTPEAAPAAPAPAAAEAPATPIPAAPPSPSAPSHAPSVPVEAAAADPALLARYGQALSDILAQQQKYPRLAAVRGWEGDVVLKLVIARKGQLIGAQVIRSSGHAILDESALALVTAAQPFPPVPGQATGSDLEVTVPIHYQLRKS